MAKQKSSASSAASDLLVITLTDIVTEMVEAKCAKLGARERGTLERRIAKAVGVFVNGLQLSPAQRKAEEKRQSLRAK